MRFPAPRLLLFALIPATLLPALAALGATAAQDGWMNRKHDDGRPHRLENLEGDDCIRCHRAVGDEWAQSMHAMAWIDPHFQDELKTIRRKKGCTGCHAPKDMLPAGVPQKPSKRAENPHLGIHCTTCHLDADGQTIHGPAGRATEAHPTQASELFDHEQSNAICIACHATTVGPVLGIAKDFVDAEQAELGLSCVDCHMRKVKRPWANREEGEAGEPYPARAARNHNLAGARDPKLLRSAFKLRAKKSEGGVLLSIENTTGHRIPGLNTRAFEFRATLLNAAGETVAEAAHRIDHKTFLAVEGTLEIPLEGAGEKLSVLGLHHSPGVEAPFEFYKRDLKPR